MIKFDIQKKIIEKVFFISKANTVRGEYVLLVIIRNTCFRLKREKRHGNASGLKLIVVIDKVEKVRKLVFGKKETCT